MIIGSKMRLSTGSLQMLVLGLFGISFFFARVGLAESLGDCSSEPQLSARTDVVFCEPWEDALWWRDHGFAATDRDPLDCNTVINSIDRQECFDTNTHPVVSGSRIVSEVSNGVPCVFGSCVQINIPQGEFGKFSTKWLFLENTGQEPEQMYYRYYLRFSDNWNPAMCSSGDQGGKLPGLSHTKTTKDPEGQCGNGGNTPDADTHCWSMRTTHTSCISGGKNVCDQNPLATFQYGSYLYFPGQQTSTGSAGMWHDGLDHWSSTSGSGGSCDTNPNNVSCGIAGGGMLEPGRWYEVEMMVKMNTPGQSNGIIRGWVNGVLSFEKPNMIFRAAGHAEIHVREAWLNIFMGGTQGSCADIQIYVDQMVLATDSRIGPVGGGVAPRPPTDVSVD